MLVLEQQYRDWSQQPTCQHQIQKKENWNAANKACRQSLMNYTEHFEKLCSGKKRKIKMANKEQRTR